MHDPPCGCGLPPSKKYAISMSSMETGPETKIVLAWPQAEKIRRLLWPVSVGYIVGLLSLFASMEWIGERNWILSILIYLPVHLWLLPLAVLIPASLHFRSWRCLGLLVCVIPAALFFAPYHWAGQPAPPDGSLTFLTNNIANNNHQSVQPFIRQQNPDIIALQEAPGQKWRYSKAFPGRFVAGCNQFLLISKYPVISAIAVENADWLGRPVAARFELDINGKFLVVYNIHMPTPRPDFAKLWGFGLFRETLGVARNRRRSDGRSYRESMDARIELAESLVRQISAEKLPFVLMGDFNMPDHGYIHQLFASHFTDAFAKSGRGWGWTFPGFGSHDFGMLGPWLRIDYVFAGPGWNPVYCKTEPGRRSKHRAVVACLEPVAKN
jgi:endonuclease/exonuclease/phosphatase family metal-dependent hydrolase